MRKRLLPLFFALSFFCIPPFVHAASVSVTNPWILEAPPTAKSFAAYMIIRNTGKQQTYLLEVTCPDFGSAEIHQSSMHQGVAHMMALKSLPIKPGGKVILEPGSFHIMLLNPHKPVSLGDQFMLQLRFDNGESLQIPAEVRRHR